MPQLGSVQSLAYTIGMLAGLQKHPEVKEIISKQLGSDEAAEKFAEDLFKIAQSFYD